MKLKTNVKIANIKGQSEEDSRKRLKEMSNCWQKRKERLRNPDAVQRLPTRMPKYVAVETQDAESKLNPSTLSSKGLVIKNSFGSLKNERKKKE